MRQLVMRHESTEWPYVIFSSIKHPQQTMVQKSLKDFHPPLNTITITSSNFRASWKEITPVILIARFNSVSLSRRIIRALMRRSTSMRHIFRYLSISLLKNQRHILMQPHNARHFEYVKALEMLDKKSWAILVDSRDLVFQVSPREIIKNLDNSKKLHLFLEDGSHFKDGSPLLNNHSISNWNWAAQLRNYNYPEIDFLKETKIVNSGCIIGRVSELITFLEESCNLLSNSLHSSYSLLDQAAVNYLAYGEKFTSQVELHANGEIVLNMCGVIPDVVEINKGILYRKKQVIPIVHQFDRFGSWDILTGFTFHKREYKVQT